MSDFHITEDAKRLQPLDQQLYVDESISLMNVIGANANVNESARLYTNPFEETNMALDGGQPLYKSLPGRLITQSVARGVFAALMFTAGSYMIREWKPGADFNEQRWFTVPLEALSRTLDTLVTAPTKQLVGLFVQDQQALDQLFTFNQYMAKSHMVDKAMQGADLSRADVFGMSWGEEMVQRTWAFAAGSIGAAAGRNFVAVLDPNYKTSWLKNGKIDWEDLAKSTAKETLRILTYNQGEDWFAAPFYTWQMRAMRSGFRNGLTNDAAGDAGIWDMHNGGNGTSRVVLPDNSLGQSMDMAGAIDFQSRFMLYNFYTLVYRDMYNHLGHEFSRWKENGFPLKLELGEDPIGNGAHQVSEFGKYLAKSLIKSQIYMAPSVLAFWPQNVGISKGNQYLIDQETGTFLTTTPARPFDARNPEDWQKPFIENGIPTVHSKIAARASDIRQGNMLYRVEEESGEGFHIHQPFYNAFQEHHHPLEKVTNTIGEIGNNYSSLLKKYITLPIANNLVEHYDVSSRTTSNISWATDVFAQAQMAYFPYMTAKYEFAQLWDTPQMDASAYRLIDGITSFNLKEAWAGLKDIGNVIALKPVSEETSAQMNKVRGPINSRFESEQSIEHSQLNMQLERIHEKQLKKMGIDPEQCANNIVPFAREKNSGFSEQAAMNNIVPFARVDDAKHDGKALAGVTSQLEKS